MRFSLLVGLCLLVVACANTSNTPAAGGTPAVLSSTELDAVKAVDAAFAAGMNARDAAAVFAVYADDAKLMPPDSPILVGAAGHPIITDLIAAGASDFVLTPTTAYGVGDLAYLVGTASFKISGGSETVKYAEVLKRGDDGKWRYVVDMFSSIEAPTAPTAPALKK